MQRSRQQVRCSKSRERVALRRGPVRLYELDLRNGSRHGVRCVIHFLSLVDGATEHKKSEESREFVADLKTLKTQSMQLMKTPSGF